jgi:hypothetical protein
MDAAAAALSANLLATDPAGPAQADAPFKLVLDLEAWAPRLEGNFEDGSGPDGDEVDVRTPDLHDMELVLTGALTARRGRLGVGIRGFSFSTSGGGTADDAFTLADVGVGAGDAFDSSFSWWSAGAEVRYDLYTPLAERAYAWSEPRAGWKPSANGTELPVFVLVAADIGSIERTIVNRTTGASSDASEAFVTLMAGAGFELSFDAGAVPFVERVTVGARAEAGLAVPPGDGDLGCAARVEASIAARFRCGTSAYFGYRFLGVSLDGDEVDLDGSLQGLRAGVSFEF